MQKYNRVNVQWSSKIPLDLTFISKKSEGSRFSFSVPHTFHPISHFHIKVSNMNIILFSTRNYIKENGDLHEPSHSFC